MRTLFTIIVIIFAISGCSKYSIDDENKQPEDINVKIEFIIPDDIDIERTGIMHPIRVFYTNNKSLETKYNDFFENEELILKLDTGNYSINIITGFNEKFCNVKNNILGEKIIEMKNNCVTDKPMMSAHTVTSINKSTVIKVTPKFIVASAEVELNNIPKEAESINIFISPVNKSYHVEGEKTTDSGTVCIECYKKENKWIADQKYLFPSENTSAKIVIDIDMGNETISYNFNLKDKLETGQPYKFIGTYYENLDLEDDMEFEGWDTDKDIQLDLTEESEDTDDTNNPNDQEYIYNTDDETCSCKEIPAEGVMWGPFYVWKSVEISSKEAQLTVIAPDQWFQTFGEGEAASILSNYQIDEINNWRTFDKTEAVEFYKYYVEGKNALNMNELLSQYGCDVFYSTARYLCENGDYAFNIHKSPNIGEAGLKTKYYLRPIKTITFKKI